MEREKKVFGRIDFSVFIYIGLFTNLFLLISSYWFSYQNFYIEIIIASILLFIGLYIKKIVSGFSLLILGLFYFLFLYSNFDYIFVFAISIILGLLIMHFLKLRTKIPLFVFSLIPLLILGHILWFNILPFGYDDSYRLNLGSSQDTSIKSELYIQDSQNVLTPPQSYGDDTWREFRKDGSFNVKLNTPVNLENKTVKVSMRYDATGPIYINGQLFYDPAWGSSVSYGSEEDRFIYGARKFNLTYTNISLVNNDFETVEDYLRYNFPNGVLMRDFTGNYFEIENEMNLKYIDSINSVKYYDTWSFEPRTIDTNFRGPIQLYGVFKDSIEVSLLKQDLNLYNGSDSVNVTIKNFDNQIIAKKRIGDNDGVVNRTTQESSWVKYSFNVPLEREGIYTIEFDHEERSDDPDFILSNITLNSNKVMINKNFYLWAPGTLYSNNLNNTIRVRYWWANYNQLIKFENNTNFDLNEELLGTWVELNLTNNSYVSFEKGKLIIEPKYNLAVFENSYIDTDLKQEVIITQSINLAQENIDFVDINGLNITSTKGTTISRIDIDIS